MGHQSCHCTMSLWLAQQINGIARSWVWVNNQKMDESPNSSTWPVDIHRQWYRGPYRGTSHGHTKHKLSITAPRLGGLGTGFSMLMCGCGGDVKGGCQGWLIKRARSSSWISMMLDDDSWWLEVIWSLIWMIVDHDGLAIMVGKDWWLIMMSSSNGWIWMMFERGGYK